MNQRVTRTFVLSALFAIVAGALLAQQKGPGQKEDRSMKQDQASALLSGHTRVLDLGHALGPDNPAWPGDAHPFEATLNATIEKDGYFTRKFTSLEHFGTHLDAPGHFVLGGWTVDQIPVQRLFGPAVVLDVQKESGHNADYLLATEKIAQWESRHGRIPAGAIVLLRTGWAERWPDAARYRNQDASGTMHFPGYSVEAVKILIERGAVGLGIDDMSVDYGASSDFPVHHLSHGAGLYHVENLADLSALPEAGAYVVVAPIKLEGGSGGPARVFALLPQAP
jgi:kynurenine formamidase